MTPPEETAIPAGSADIPTDSLIRRLAYRYLLVLVAVAVLMIVDQVVIQPLLVQLSSYAPTINVAGRQRMLSQKLSKSALALAAADDEATRLLRRDELRETLRQWSAAHLALHDGNGLGVAKVESPDAMADWNELEPHFLAMCAGASELVAQSSPRPGNADDAAIQQRAVAAILAHEGPFLTAMDHVVKVLESEAGHQLLRLRLGALAIATSVIVLLLGVGWFVVWPATRTMRAQVRELESRVAQRTADLAQANRALEHEMLERGKAEAKTQRLASELAHAARVSTMGHLTAGLAHELNQPLAAITNYAETCEVLLSPQASADSAFQRHIIQIRQAALRAGQIVRRMRNFVRPGAEPAVAVDVNVLVHEVAELCRAEAERAEVCLLLDLARLELIVQADPIQIQQVLVNLIRNAIDALQANPADQRRLCIRTSLAESLVKVDVSDSGPGFAGTDSEFLFTPFHTTKADGLGIGLAICRSIVERHGGTIWANSSPGRGATIYFTLPRQRMNDATSREPADCICR